MASKGLMIGALSLIIGGGIAFFNMFRWSAVQYSIEYSVKDPAVLVLEFYLAQALSTVLVVIGLYQVYRSLTLRRLAETPTITSVLGEALRSSRALRIGAAVAVVYAIVYAVFSSVIAYQPTVDFAQAYGVTQPSWSYLSCCGDTGTIPEISVYLAPSLHLGMVLVPLSLLFLFVVPLLVGFNVMMSYYALRQASFPMSGRWLMSSGAVVGLFTACPTCAGLFLAGSIGGLGTTLAVALAPYQLLFIAVTIPVLLSGPFFTALSVKRSYEASCRVPSAVGMGQMRAG
ncbi:MAG: hypothetical protein OK474_03900 [Thaumarchaeota archaeon]|nr:hypothetical protein [Nitrososphaerota archaeon]